MDQFLWHSPPFPEGEGLEGSPRLGKEPWMCRKDRAGHRSLGKRSSPVPSGAPGAPPALPGEGESCLDLWGEALSSPQLRAGAGRGLEPKSSSHPHFSQSHPRVAAVNLQGAHAELLAGVVEDEPVGLGSIQTSPKKTFPN